MAYPLKKTNFYFRVGEKPEESMKSMLESIGVRVITSHMIPLSLGGGMRMEIFIDKLDKDAGDINASLDVHTGYLCVPTTVWVGNPDDNPPPPPVKDWLYEIVTLKDVFVRDQFGNLLPDPNRLIGTGVQLKIYQELAVIGPNAQNLTYTNRGVINKDSKSNIWLDVSVARRL
jgi:hypothetical protein